MAFLEFFLLYVVVVVSDRHSSDAFPCIRFALSMWATCFRKNSIMVRSDRLYSCTFVRLKSVSMLVRCWIFLYSSCMTRKRGMLFVVPSSLCISCLSDMMFASVVMVAATSLLPAGCCAGPVPVPRKALTNRHKV